jgi:hypothetical protein
MELLDFAQSGKSILYARIQKAGSSAMKARGIVELEHRLELTHRSSSISAPPQKLFVEVRR